MPNAPIVNINEVDSSFSNIVEASGIYGVIGKFPTGPIFSPDVVFNSFEVFKKIYGDLPNPASPYYSSIIQVKRALDRGASLRVCRVEESSSYDIDWAANLSGKVAEMASIFAHEISENFVTSNVIQFTIFGQLRTINFDINSGETLEAVAASIELHPLVTKAWAESRSLFFIAETANNPLDDWSVTGGTAQPTISFEGKQSAIINTDSVPAILFSLEAKYLGASNNGMVVAISEASNGDLDAFNLTITLGNIRESYTNLKVQKVSAANADFLRVISLNSTLVKPVYFNLEAFFSPIRPLKTISYKFHSGVDGEPTNASYAGIAEARTGIYAFNPYDDFTDLAILDNHDSSLIANIKNYASGRKDITLYFGLDLLAESTLAIVAERDQGSADDSYLAFMYGGLKIKDPKTLQDTDIRELGDLLAILAYTDKNFGPWLAPGGPNRGVVPDALGVVNNFGSQGSYQDLNYLANRQVNCFVMRDRKVMLFGDYTSQVAESSLSRLAIRRYLNHVKRTLRPILERYLLEPNDIPIWKLLFLEVTPVLNFWVSVGALYEYVWQGDQDASSLDNLQINTRTEVLQGKYKIKLVLVIVPGILEITLEINASNNIITISEA